MDRVYSSRLCFVDLSSLALCLSDLAYLFDLSSADLVYPCSLDLFCPFDLAYLSDLYFVYPSDLYFGLSFDRLFCLDYSCPCFAVPVSFSLPASSSLFHNCSGLVHYQVRLSWPV